MNLHSLCRVIAAVQNSKGNYPNALWLGLTCTVPAYSGTLAHATGMAAITSSVR